MYGITAAQHSTLISTLCYKSCFMPSVLLSPILLPPDSDTPALGFGLLSPLAPSEVQRLRRHRHSQRAAAQLSVSAARSVRLEGVKEGVRSGRERNVATRSVLAQCLHREVLM